MSITLSKKSCLMSAGYWREGFVMVQRAVDVALRDYFTGETTDPLAPAVQVSTI